MVHTAGAMVLWFVLYSFIGWMYESILCSVAGKKLVNRGFLNGPVCPVYGTGAVAVVFVLSPLKDKPLALFLTSALLTTSLEYLTSWAMEKLFHARWWDYSKRFLNIHGRVCLRGFVAFGGDVGAGGALCAPARGGADGAALGTGHAHTRGGAGAAICGGSDADAHHVLGLDKRLRDAREALREQLEERNSPACAACTPSR